MSQDRKKKQLSTADNVNSLTDHELREALKEYNQSPGPITDSTRNLYRKKLISLIEGVANLSTNNSLDRSRLSMKPSSRSTTNPGVDDNNDDSDDDTSDEDYIVQEDEDDEDEDEEEETEEDESEVSDEDEEDEDPRHLLEELEDDIKLSNSMAANETLNNSLVNGIEPTASRISRSILIGFVSLLVVVFSMYLYMMNNETAERFKSYSKVALTIFIVSPAFYALFRLHRFYKQRRHQENQRVCELVNEALELLQSPDNPKGLMPILHIRDTLLTPAERKSKKAIDVWKKAVKFMEEHESRVKVELVNIDGEDFRAWKWIGSKKL